LSHLLSHYFAFGGNLRNFDQNRQAHNLKVVGSNPPLGTTLFLYKTCLEPKSLLQLISLRISGLFKKSQTCCDGEVMEENL